MVVVWVSVKSHVRSFYWICKAMSFASSSGFSLNSADHFNEMTEPFFFFNTSNKKGLSSLGLMFVITISCLLARKCFILFHCVSS